MTLEELLKKLEENLKEIASEDRKEIDKILQEYKEEKKVPDLKELQDKIDALVLRQKAKGDEPNLKPPVRKIDFSDGPKVEARSINKIMRLPARELNDQEKELQTFMDKAYITATILKTDPRNLKMWQSFDTSRSALRKAMDTATAEEGAEWVPTFLSTELIEKFRLESKVAKLFRDIPMPSNPYDLPFISGSIDFYLVPESISDEPSKAPPSTPGTGKRTLTAGKLKARVLFSDELNEDSIIPIIPNLKEELTKSGAEAWDDVILNGDNDAATPMDYDIISTKDRRRIFKGIRALFEASAATVVDNATFTITTFRAIVTAMGKWGLQPSKLAVIAGVTSYNELRGLAEVITLDKYGDRAVIFTGEIAKLDGISIITSEKVRQDLHTTGYADQAARLKTELIVVYVPGILLGTRGVPKLTFKEDAEVDQNQLIVSFRKALVDRWDVTTVGNEFIGIGGGMG